MTIQSPETILEILTNKGMMEGQRMARVYRYMHANNNDKLYAVFTNQRWDDMASSPYVSNPELLMIDGELTDAEKDELATLQKLNESK